MIDQKKWFIVLKWLQIIVPDYLYTLLKFVQIPLIQEMISLSNFSHVSLFPPSMICSGSAAGLAGFAGTENLSNMYVWLMNNASQSFLLHSLFTLNKSKWWITYSCFIMPQLAIKLVFIFPHVTRYSLIVYLVSIHITIVPMNFRSNLSYRCPHMITFIWTLIIIV